MPKSLADRIEKIIRDHQPDMERSCWANERFCFGCGDNIHLYIGGYERHQAEEIEEMLRSRLGV